MLKRLGRKEEKKVPGDPQWREIEWATFKSETQSA
jgi:hypothetical protein